MKEKRLALLNVFSVILVLFVNYYSQIFGINGNTVGSLSGDYDNIFTPAGYAFAIWGIIFLLLIAYCSYQLREVFSRINPDPTVGQTGYWFFVANLLNASWVVVWLFELTWLSVLVMIGLLVCLIKIILNTRIGEGQVSWRTLIFNWWPISIYAGWISVATIANLSAFFSKVGWKGGFLSEVQWTLLMICVAVVLNSVIIWRRNLRAFALVGVWALYAIHVRQEGNYELVSNFAFVGAMVLLVQVFVHRLKAGLG